MSRTWNHVRLICLTLVFALHLEACSHLFYFPDANSYRDPRTYPFPVETLSIPRDHDGPIHAWLMNDDPASKGLVVHFHGNAQNLTAHADFSAWLAQSGYTVLIFDYSGYGKTKGRPTQKQLIDDSADVFRWVFAQKKWAKKGAPLIVFAQSLGGAVATTTLAEHSEIADKIDFILVESSFDSYRAVAYEKLSESPVTWLFSPLGLWAVSEYRKPADAVHILTMPKLFVHGNHDQVVPFVNGKALYEAARPPKEFWEIPYGDHTQAFVPGSPYRAQLLEMLAHIKDPGFQLR
ncbi:MAG: alpha/beta hydrolase [Chitinophagaceae bacterium]|nr:alpha/beta hydrolase [Oligoflexus sp.]